MGKEYFHSLYSLTPVQTGDLLPSGYPQRHWKHQLYYTRCCYWQHYNYAAGEENRQSYGFRIFSQKPILNYELEATYQSGKFNRINISPYGISADVNYKLVFRHNFIIGLGSNYMSGDKNKNDHQLNTFNSIISKPPFVLIVTIGL